MVFLENNIVRLRALEPTDLKLTYRWENDSTQWANGAVNAPLSHKVLAEYIASATADIYTDRQLRLIIEDRASSMAVGAADLYDFDPRNGRAGVGIMISADWRRRGYAKAALGLLADYACIHLAMTQLWAVIACDNQGSLSLFSKAGYKQCGRLRSWIRSDAGMVDAIIWQLVFE